MTRQTTAIPVWSDANVPSPEVLIEETEHLHFAPSTIERAIDRLKDEQAEWLEREAMGFPTAAPQRRRPTTTTVTGFPRPEPAPVVVSHVDPKPEPALAAAVCAPVDVLAGVHPLVAADALRRCEGDLRRVTVLSPTSVRVLNRASGE